MDSNEIGLNEAEITELPSGVLLRKLERARARMYQTGAHYVVDSIADVLPLLDEIEKRLAREEKP